MLNLFGGKKPERPYLKVCTQCHGKGQTSHFDGGLDKKYGGCDKCSSGNGPSGLGVTLKCKCDQKSTKYEFLRVPELKHMKGLEDYLVKGLKEYQQQLGDEGTAICMMCDCGARYLVMDVGTRRHIRGDGPENEEDKEFNKQIAKDLAGRGIQRVLRPSPGGV